VFDESSETLKGLKAQNDKGDEEEINLSYCQKHKELAE